MPSGYTIPGVTTQDEGLNVGFAGIMNFTGAGVSASASGAVVTVNIPGGGGGSTDHATLSNLQWANSAHVGLTTSVAAWQANASTPVVVQAAADETMLVRRGGVLQWIPIPVVVAGLAFSGLSGSMPGDLSLGTVTITTGVFA